MDGPDPDIHADAIEALAGHDPTPSGPGLSPGPGTSSGAVGPGGVDPDGLDGASTNQPSPIPDPAPEPEPDPEPVAIDPAEHEALVGQVAALQARLRDLEGRSSSAESERQALARDILARDQKLSEVDARYRTATLERDLYGALADHPLVPGTADQIAQLVRGGLEVVADGDGLATRSKAGRPIGEHLAEVLADAKFAHFLKPTGGGGSGSTGTDMGGPWVAKTPDDEVFENFRRQQAAMERDPGYFPAMGLGPATRRH